MKVTFIFTLPTQILHPVFPHPKKWLLTEKYFFFAGVGIGDEQRFDFFPRTHLGFVASRKENDCGTHTYGVVGKLTGQTESNGRP